MITEDRRPADADHTASNGQPVQWRDQLRRRAVQPIQDRRGLTRRVMFIGHRPLLDPGALPFKRRGPPRHDHTGQRPLLQEGRQSLLETPLLPLRRQPCRMNTASASAARSG